MFNLNKFFLVSVLLIICLSWGVVVAETVSAANKDIYVSSSGDDSSNSGNLTSPYSTVEKAINGSGDSDNVKIYLGEGIFRGVGNTKIGINKAHKSQGGSITIIGQGKDKTFIDGDFASYIFDIKADSIVSLYNLTIRNCKNTQGGSIVNSGNLSITNSNFENNQATSYGGAIYSYSYENNVQLNVFNSTFNNNTASPASYGGFGGAIYAPYSKIDNCNFTNNLASNNIITLNNVNSSISNCYFINNTVNGSESYGVLYVSSGSIINNTFTNCTSPNSVSTPSIFISGAVYLKNNTIINCFNRNGQSFIRSDNADVNLNLTFINNSTMNINNLNNIILTAYVTDDNGNIVSGAYIYFIIQGILNQSSSTNNSGIARYTFTRLLDNGLYVVSGSGYYSFQNISIVNGTLNVTVDRTPITYYVSNDGNDDYGDGSLANPYKTIKKAIEEGFALSLYPTIKILEGTYKGVGNTNLSFTDMGILTIIGVYNKTIIDGELLNWGLKFGTYTQSNIINMSFINCHSANYNDYSFIYANAASNITNCNFINGSANTYLAGVYLINGGNVINSTFISCFSGYSNSILYIYSAGLIENCSFINNKGTRGILQLVSGTNFTVKNCFFINNTLNESGANGILYGTFNSINNNFINNSAPTNGAVINGGFNSTNDTFINNNAINGAITSGSGTFTNAKFINNSASGNGSVVYVYQNGIVDFINCSFDGNYANGTGNPIFIYSSLNSVGTLTTGKIKRVNVTYHSVYTNKYAFTLTAYVTDAEGNIIHGGYLRFYADDKYLGIAPIINGTATLTYIGFSNGNYTITGDCPSGEEVSINTANLEVNANLKDNTTFYISPNGSDSSGNGSKDNPFKTIDHALKKAYENSKKIFIYILGGNYAGIGNVNITLPGDFNITIIGAGKDKTFIHGENQSWIFEILTGSGVFEIKNLTIHDANMKYNATNSIYTSPIMISQGVSVIIHDVNIIDGNGYEGGGIRNAGNLTLINVNISNCGDMGMNSGSNQGGAIYNYATGIIYMDNCILRNNTAKYATAIYNQGKITIKNSIIADGQRIAGLTGDGNAITSFEAAILIVENCIFSGHKTGYGVQAYGNNTIVNNCTFIDTYNGVYIIGNVTNSLFKNINQTGVYVRGAVDIFGCIFENNTRAIYVSQQNATVSNSIILSPIEVTQYGNLIANYNWWGTNDKPSILGSLNYTLDYWVVLDVVLSDVSGYSNLITASLDKFTDGVDIFQFNGYLPVRDFVLTTNATNANINNVETNANIVKGLFKADKYGNYSISAIVDGYVLTKDFTLVPLNTTTDISVSSSKGKNGTKIIITAFVNKLGVNNTDINEGNVKFYINGKLIGVADVSNGCAVFEWVINETNGNYKLYALFEDTETYVGSDSETDFEVLTLLTNVTITLSKVSGNSNDKVTIIATVTDEYGNLVNSGLIEFYVNGKYLGTFNIENGKATSNWTASGNPGKYLIIAKYMDDLTYVNNQVETNFEINKLQTSISMNAFKGTYNKYIVLQATLKDGSGKAIVNKLVKFYVNNNFVGQALTNSKGVASLSYKVKKTGSCTVKALSDTDSNYFGISKSSKLSVPKMSNVKIINKATTKRKKITFRSVLANLGPDKTSFSIYYKIPKGVKIVKPKVNNGVAKYNKKSGVLTWIVKNLKLNNSKSAILTVTFSVKKGKYSIKPVVKKTSYILFSGNNVLKNIKVK
ncbi:bacterial Ig-like domain protein [Methanobrevibacter cuticularis]|uniref:Bacterial Ig-like domain protein n=1 Tax=Methanobrevibacter cuticularis TaxID=47311 RepID=A0A166CGS6_9EURY|nr:Ig-like domain-containing protein [Methanobrevibacter cuticularis]KZX14492.1 bacterial Ig-like domain protein [Methanobrevibacter cuticularis]